MKIDSTHTCTFTYSDHHVGEHAAGGVYRVVFHDCGDVVSVSKLRIDERVSRYIEPTSSLGEVLIEIAAEALNERLARGEYAKAEGAS
ncbi:MAG: hypothetical protein AAF661_15160 [Pseudomonadota bacterium]